MAIEYDWQTVDMECYPEYDGRYNVVSSVNWKCVGYEDQYSSSIVGSINIAYDSSSFTDYDNLTNDQVIGWVKNSMSSGQVYDIEKSIEHQISILKNPPVIRPNLPW